MFTLSRSFRPLSFRLKVSSSHLFRSPCFRSIHFVPKLVCPIYFVPLVFVPFISSPVFSSQSQFVTFISFPLFSFHSFRPKVGLSHLFRSPCFRSIHFVPKLVCVCPIYFVPPVFVPFISSQSRFVPRRFSNYLQYMVYISARLCLWCTL